MRYRNNKVASMWSSSPFRNVMNHEQTLRFYSDGTISSYSLLIGEIINGKHVVYDHTSKGGSFYSATTSRHVNLLKQYADRVIDYV